MILINERVVKLINNQEILMYVSTCTDNVPNVVPVGFKHVDHDKIIIGDILLNETLKNLAANKNIAVAISDPASIAGFQIKGTAEYINQGEYVDYYKEVSDKMFKGKLPVKGVLIITPEMVITTTPGPGCGKVVMKL